MPVKTQVERTDENLIDATQADHSSEYDSSEGNYNDGLKVSVHDIPYNVAFKSSRT